jgi:hypothetical protein
VLHSLGDAAKPLRKAFALPAGRPKQGDRVHFEFYTGAEGYEYSRSRLALTCRDVVLDRIMLEKKRPGGAASTYGRGAFVDATTPLQPGEVIVFP